ncbi:MAG: 16S rRNA (guanine(966)-N(2))-methyltransferase RsmD [Silicimonas sp.]|nr:16S rRNA (guanine(966)-N(2))-methyltransferase RsmD [Silicimonas sp.]
MRITGGRMRGLALASVGKGDPARALRPTSDRVRESLFNLLEHGGFGDPVSEAAVLDVFAGTGALGLEALSRGAASVVFIEDGRVALALLDENIRKARAGDRCRILRRSALKPGPSTGAATLVFLDPPYGKGLGERALAALSETGWIAPGALIVWEERGAQAAPEGFRLIETRSYGETAITLLEADA